jgi:hypothetical protein
MATKLVRFDFFQVEVVEDGVTFDSILSTARGLGKGRPRTKTVNGYPVHLHQISQSKAPTVGELIKIRMDQLPPRATLTGALNDLDLAANEGLGEETAFSYYPGYSLLLLQRNFYGVSASSFAGYFGVLSGKTLVLNPVLEPGALAKLNSIADVRNFDVAVAGVTNAKTLRAEYPDAGVKEFMDVLDTFNAPSLHVSLSMEHQRGSMDTGRVRATARKLIEIRSDKRARVKKVQVTGKTSDDEMMLVDLIKDRMIEEADVVLNNKRRLAYSSRTAALERAFKTRETQLQSLFGRSN